MTDARRSNLDIDVFPRLVSQAQADRAMPYEVKKPKKTDKTVDKYGWKNAVKDTVAFLIACGALLVLWTLASVMI